MATFKASVNKEDVNTNDTWRVRIRVTHKRVSKYISTDHYVTKKQLNKDFEIKDPDVFEELNDQIKEYRKKVTRLSTRADQMNCIELRDYLLQDAIERIDFIAFSQSIVDSIIKPGTKGNASAVLKSFKDIVGAHIDINEIGLSTLNKYEASFRSERTINRTDINGKPLVIKRKPLTDKGVRDAMLKLQQFHREAVKQYNDIGRMQVFYNPFSKYQFPVAPPTKNRDLTIQQLKAIRDCQDITAKKHKGIPMTVLARDVFMLSVYLVGMNAVDIYELTEYNCGRINYYRAKTSSRRQDKAFISIKVEKEAVSLFEKYKDPSGDRVFNFYKLYKNANTFDDALNRGLEMISEHLHFPQKITFYYARYTWANIARNHCGVSKDDVATAINHADNTHKTTDIYLVKSWKIIDEANRMVLNALLPPVYDSEDAEIHADFMEYLENNPDEASQFQ
jgi:hypothetical protein